MFIDEMFEDLLVEKKVALLDAMADVCKEKLQLKEDRTFDSVKRIENGYQLFRKRHPEYPEDAFRAWVGFRSTELAKYLGWE